MKAQTLGTAAATLALFLSACSSTKGIPRSGPSSWTSLSRGGLEYIASQSAVIESETVRAARLVYSSKYEAGSLVLSIQEALLGHGWRIVRTTSFPG